MARDALIDWLDFLFVCVRRYIHRFGHRMVQASGTLNQLYVSLDEARALLADEVPALATETAAGPPRALGLPAPAEVEAQIGAAAAALAARSDGPVGVLKRRFRLDDVQVALLMAAAGPLLSVDLSRLYGFAWADFAVKLPTVGFLAELLASRRDALFGLQSEFRPEAPLVRYRLLELRDSAAWGAPSPLLHKGVVVPDPVISFLRGQTAELPASLAAASVRSAPLATTPVDELFVADDALRELRTGLVAAVEIGRPRLLLVGQPGAGRRTLLSAVAAEVGWSVLTADLARLAQGDGFAERLAEAGREALLRQQVLLLRGDDLFEERDQWEKLAPAVGQLVNRHDGPVAFTARFPVATLHRVVGDLYDIPIELPTPPQQKLVWSRALAGGYAEDVALAEPLARRFTVSPGAIHGAVQEARARMAVSGGGPLAADEVARSVRRRLDHTLSQVAEPFATSLTWEDVILPDEVMDTLNEIMAHARFREQVYDDWGFRRKMAYGRGLACLFCGPPGTGKTMVTALIAQSLGQEIYRVDLSRVVSKWVGETEKNLARVFDEAEKAQVILLFDEADSLFSSRTEVKGSNDRFANMEINYLLQRMESYDGMSLLTTNFEKSIDDAFKRRLKFKVDFPMPDADHRAKLWQAMLPDKAAVTDDIQWEVLGKKYKLSGGNIKNAVLRAAFYAVEAGTAIDHALLERAAIAESREMGRLI